MRTPRLPAPWNRRTPANIPALVWFLLSTLPLPGSVLTNLQAFPDRIAVGDPSVAAADREEGPKGVATADFNGDGKPDLAVSNLDSSITVLLNADGGRFQAPRHLQTGAKELRGVIAADLNNDGKPDLAVASPEDAQLMVFYNNGGGNFGPKTLLPGWVGVRSLAAGDFDGDGLMDLAAAGPGMGVRHFRGTSSGAFENLGDLTRVSPKNLDLTRPRPVYAMRTLRSRDGLRDDLLVTHADNPALWILSTVVPDRRTEPPVLTRPESWAPLPAVVLNEVQLQNTNTLRDADGTTPPWVELLNKSAVPVNLTGWMLRLQTATWTFPPVTIQPGRFLIVFLSGKNRVGAELHTGFILKESTDAIHLERPGGIPAHMVGMEKHSVNGVARGLAPDTGEVKWFDIPSPGAENNAGIPDLDNLSRESITLVTITPPTPAPSQPVTIRVVTPQKPTGTTSVRVVWFSTTPGLTENHYPLRWMAPGVYEAVLPPGSFRAGSPHRVLARLREDSSINDYTVELYHGSPVVAGSGPVAPRPGCLTPVASVPCSQAKSFETGPIVSTLNQAGAPPDLVYANDEDGFLRIHRAAPDARRFEPVPSQSLPVSGVPRDVKLEDMDLDGWLDAFVVLRETDLAVTCKNSGGQLRRYTVEFDTGDSPREAVIADFTGDGRPDAAIINRYSANVSILVNSSSVDGLVSLDQIYPVDGDVAAMTVKDFDGDGRDDVLQLHRASSEISIRHAGADGLLEAPVFWPVGAAGASALALADVNHDGRDDVVTANLGVRRDGSISVLLGTASGGFAAPRVFNAGASLFAIGVADFNRDGNQDVVAGLWDCSVKFFYGNSTGEFIAALELPVPFVNEARIMVTQDFDQDGDVDIAGAGIEGDMATLENNLNGAVAGPPWIKRYYPAPGVNVYGANRIGITKLNADDDPDLLVATGYGMLLFEGRAGMEFHAVPQEEAGDPSTGVPYAVSDVLTVDIDGDDALDMVAACRAAACLNVLAQRADGQFIRTLQVDVPSARYIATGDLDLDGKPDLVGTGDVLWTVLSSRPPQLAAPSSNRTSRPQTTGVVLNEVLARNKSVSVSADNKRNSDYVEIFNGGPNVDLAGWRLRVQSNQEGTPLEQTWTLPSMPGTIVASNSVSVIVFAELDPALIGGTAPRTGFVLPAEGGTITLLRPDNSVADRVEYPQAQEDVSWSRFLDGHPSFHADPVPTPGLSNADNGRAQPEVKLYAPSPSALRPGQPIKFTARGRDDLGIISLSLFWNRLDIPFPKPQRLNLYDDGRHGDGPAVDGIFAATMPGLPAGAEVQFYLEATDLSGAGISMPEVAELSPPGTPPVAWSFTIGEAPALQITEVCSSNGTLLRDERGGHPDYIKIQNRGTVSLNLSNIVLANSPLSENVSLYAFPRGVNLAPGAEITILADGRPDKGPLHAPFSLSSEGDDLSLLAIMPSGARQWIHSLSVPKSAPDARYLRIPSADLSTFVESGAGLEAWAGTAWDDHGTAFAAVRFLAAAGKTYRIEGEVPSAPGTWSTLENIAGDNAAHTVARPLTENTALRCLIPSEFSVQVDAALPWYDLSHGCVAGIYGRVAGAVAGPFAARLYVSRSADLSMPVIVTAPVMANEFEFLPQLDVDTLYYYRVGIDHSTAGAWFTQGTPFRTPLPVATNPSLINYTFLPSDRVKLSVPVAVPAAPQLTLTLLLGTRDEFGDVAAWQRRAPAVSGAATFSDLTPGTGYYARVLTSSSTQTVVSGWRLQFQTPAYSSGDNTGILRFSEIMYNPPAPSFNEAAAGYLAEDFEFIELYNVSNAALDLSGMWTEGIDFDFPQSGGPVIPAGGYAVIATNPQAFAMRYGRGIPLAGWTLHPFRNNRLSNGGEDLALYRADGSLVLQAGYNDDPFSTDGGGYSLEWGTNGFNASMWFGGSPGSPSPAMGTRLPYSQWSQRQFTGSQLANPGISGFYADPDRDGMNNFTEYAAHSDPLSTGPRDVLGIQDGGILNGQKTMRLTFPVNPAADASWVLEYLSAGWSTVGTFRQLNPTSGPPYSGIGGSTMEYYVPDGDRALVTILVPLDALPRGHQPRGFFRLRITSN